MKRTAEREELVASLAHTTAATLDPLLDGFDSFALIGFPNHSNVGDSAIWLGQLEYLERRGGRVVYMCDEWSYDRTELARRLDGGAILLTGGGSLGDVWPDYQRLREDVVASFPEHAIVQLPQTITFRARANLERAARLFDGHDRFTLLVRDEDSLALGRQSFGCPVVLCPDMAFSLGSLRLPRGERELLALVRSDVESGGARAALRADGSDCVDWPALPRRALALRQTSRRLGRLVSRRRRWFRRFTPQLYAMYESLARERLDSGTRLLASSRAVVTDRLHAHILCVLLGIPHVCIDTSFGKIRSFVETWTYGSELVQLAPDPVEAAARARELGRA
jgi:exopolysaccharide biosynthesis protein PssK